MVNTTTCVRNAAARWNDFSAQEYWRHNYATVHPEDREIIRRVSDFFSRVFARRARVHLAIDVGSGSNLYPALLMLPWTNHMLLTDYSTSNIDWLHHHVYDDDALWTWQPFWQELGNRPGYAEISEPRKQLQRACDESEPAAGIHEYSVFGLPQAQWQLGTMFFVAESITQDPAEFSAAVKRFVRALQPGAPFAATFMAGSAGYPVAGIQFPALQVTRRDVVECFSKLGVRELTVDLNRTPHRVRPGYEGMIVATGIVGDR